MKFTDIEKDEIQNLLYGYDCEYIPQLKEATDKIFNYLQEKVSPFEARVSPKVADILKICKRSLPNARVLNANPQFAKGWEDAYKQLIDYINDLKD